jgi:hypothetical protein
MTCYPVLDQLVEGISAGETERTANPVQTTGFLGVISGFI